MSAPRYYLEVGLTGTDFRYRMKLKTRVGDHKGLQKESHLKKNTNKLSKKYKYLIIK